MGIDFRKKSLRKSRKFNPTRNELNKAMDEFLTAGGEIKKVSASDYSIQQFVMINDRDSGADDFLNEGNNSDTMGPKFSVPDVLS